MRVEVENEEKQTRMSSWSDRQSSIVTVSGWFGARTVVWDFPPNRRISGNSTDLGYSSARVSMPISVQREVK